MGKYLNVGNAGFEAVRKGIYVDKNDMISYINGILGTTDKMMCVSRPRRFGKSFAAKMLCAYYDKSCDSRELFDGLEISKDATFNKVKSIYNPNSVMEAIKSEEFGNYWTQTETYTSLQFYIDMNEDGLKEAITQMLGDARIKIDVGTFQVTIQNHPYSKMKSG